MNKQEIKNNYSETCSSLGFDKLTRKQFVKSSGISRRQIDNLFGSFNNLKSEVCGIPIISEDQPLKSVGKNLESVLETCGVDTEVWDVSEFNTKELSSGDFLFTIYLKKKKCSVDFKSVIQNIRDFIPSVESHKRPNSSSEGLLCEINIADLHLGKLCHISETGNNYDLKIASKIFREAIDYKIEQLLKYKVEKIFFVLGNDFYHFDNLEITTTAGTKQDSDTRLPKMFQEGVKLIIEAIIKLQEIAPVTGIIVSGNHGNVLEFCMGEVLNAYFYNNDNVTIDNEPTPRKYYRYGKNLISYLHGDGIKFAQLPLLMASEAKKDWGETNHHFIRVGHYHHQKIILDEVSGCTLEVLPSLSGTDFWHKKKGFCNNLRAAQTALYDKENGLVAKIYFNL